MMNTIVELPEFLRCSRNLFTEKAKDELIHFLAANPTAGIILEGTGGIRKLRWQSGNRGKSGGARVIYYYHNSNYPLFLLTAFGKNEKENLSKAERNLLAKLTQQLLGSVCLSFLLELSPKISTIEAKSEVNSGSTDKGFNEECANFRHNPKGDGYFPRLLC